jgi:uncharacterized protein YnzC (UPF0291/DUF896 family)
MLTWYIRFWYIWESFAYSGDMKSIYDQDYRTIIERLSSKRKELGITQVELSTRLGFPQPYISKIETYVRRLDIIETIRICEALGIDVIELIQFKKQA